MANIEDRRTIHGGADSALEIEVSAWREYRTEGGERAVDGCNSEPTTAHGFGVYVRNPLAFHLQDFEVWPADYGKPVPMRKALADAFAWADALGDHLGAPVHSALSRDLFTLAKERADQAARVVYPVDTIAEVAAVLWEAALEAKSGDAPLAVAANEAFEADGTAALRYFVVGLASECETAWRALGEAGQEDAGEFDWEWAPAWLYHRLGWSEELPGTPGKPPVQHGPRDMVGADILAGVTFSGRQAETLGRWAAYAWATTTETGK